MIKKYCLGVRNNPHHAYRMIFQTNYKWIALLFSWIYKPLTNEIDISKTSNIVIKNNKQPFAKEYLHQKDAKNTYFYIWRGWWQRVSKIIYDYWDGEKFYTYFLLDEDDEEIFESICIYEQ